MTTEITFRHMSPSPAAERKVHERIEQLERLCPDITHCRVVVDAPHKHHHKGKLYSVRIDLHVPEDGVLVTRTGRAWPW